MFSNIKYVHQFLEESAQHYADKIALIHERTRVTYGSIDANSNNLALFLKERGFKQGDRIIIIAVNSLEYVIAYYGIMKIGAIAVPLATDIKPHELKSIIADLNATAIISHLRFKRVLKVCEPYDLKKFQVIYIQQHEAKSPTPKFTPNTYGFISYFDVLPYAPPPISQQKSYLPANTTEHATASIIYTSGSTGKPKGVMLSHRNIVHNVQAICASLTITKNDIQMVVLPFSYVMGISLLNTHFAVGATIVINNTFAYPVTVLDQMVKENVTSFSGVPSTFAYLLHRSPIEKYKRKLKHLRYCSQAGGHMANHLKIELNQALPDHTQIFIMYGATEASARLTCLSPDMYLKKIGSIGKPINGVTLSIITNKLERPKPYDNGELVAKGNNIMLGYWNDSDSTQDVLDEHGYHTKDIGYVDAEGYFFISERKDNIIKIGGHKISPTEVEDALMATGLIIEACTMGVSDQLMASKLVALVVPIRKDISSNEIISKCKHILPKYKRPTSIQYCRALPKTNNGKIDKGKCLEIVMKKSSHQK